MFMVTTSDVDGVDWKDKDDVLREEAEYIWNLQKSGAVRNIWFTDPERDAVILFDAESWEKVQELTRNMPLVKNSLITCRIKHLNAYDGYERLFKRN